MRYGERERPELRSDDLLIEAQAVPAAAVCLAVFVLPTGLSFKLPAERVTALRLISGQDL